MYELWCRNLHTQVIDSVEDYLKLLRTIFDFDALKALLHKPDFTFTFDAMHGVSGPYAKRIFVQVCRSWAVAHPFCPMTPTCILPFLSGMCCSVHNLL